MSHRPRLGALALLLAGCTLVFPHADPDRKREDAGVPDAGSPDAARDADPGEWCPDRTLEGRMPDDCLGCGLPCGPGRPYCCAGECCTEECGAPDNVCSRRYEPPPDGGAGDADADADADGDADGCDHREYESCRGCGKPCYASRPFCCLGTCCTDECGARPNDCSELDERPLE